MTSFTKLFSTITASTIWQEPDATRLVWITMLACADQNGYVGASIPGLASLARVSLEDCITALETLGQPDKYSRSKEFEGRRIIEADGGFVLLNYQKYREIRQADERREQVRQAVQRHREKAKGAATGNQDVIKSNQCKPRKAQAEAEAEAEAGSKKESMSSGDDLAAAISAFNAVALECGWPACQRLSPQRRSSLRARLGEVGGLAGWEAAMAKARASPFLRGETGRSEGHENWRPGIDFFLAPAKFTKLMEGGYDGGPNSGGQSRGQRQRSERRAGIFDALSDMEGGLVPD
jgi:hypothetical protein